MVFLIISSQSKLIYEYFNAFDEFFNGNVKILHLF